MKTVFVSDCLLQNVDDIKLAALYFDEIEIIRRVRLDNLAVLRDDEQMTVSIKGDAYPFVSAELTEHLEVLSREGIVTFSTSTHPKPVFFQQTDQPRTLTREAKQIVGENVDVIFPDAPFERTSKTQFSLKVPADYLLVANEEGEAIYASPELRKYGDSEYESVNKLVYLLDYYTALREELLYALDTKASCITSSSTLQRLVGSYTRSRTYEDLRLAIERRVDRSPAVAFEALRWAVPDLSSARSKISLSFAARPPMNWPASAITCRNYYPRVCLRAAHRKAWPKRKPSLILKSNRQSKTLSVRSGG